MRDKNEDILRLINCNAGNETYSLDMSWVRSIQRTDSLKPIRNIKGDDSGFVGWLPGKEDNIPVFSLANRLKHIASPSKIKATQRIIVLPASLQSDIDKKNDGDWALLVDYVSQVIQISKEQLKPLPPIVTNPMANYFNGVVQLEDTLNLLISPEHLHPNYIAKNGKRKNIGGGSEQKAEITKSAKQESQIGRIMVFSTTTTKSDERDILFGLSFAQIPEILNPLPIIPVPESPPFTLGIVNWRNHPIPIIDLNARLGLEERTATELPRLIIARGAERDSFIGFPIQFAIRALQLPIKHQPSTRSLPVNQRFIKGIVELENETLIIPEIQAILKQDS